MKKLFLVTVLLITTRLHALDKNGQGATRTKANSIYVFNSANIINGIVKDQITSPEGLDLEIMKKNALYQVTQEYLEISEPNLIRSVKSADKIINACKKSNEMTIELWIESKTPSEKLVNNEADNLPAGNFLQSLRIVSLADIYFKELRNFGFYQGYDMGDIYKSSIRTSGNSANLNGDLVNPFRSAKEAFTLQQLQHLFFVKDAGGTVRFYTSDETGQVSLSARSAVNFGGTFANWFESAKTVTMDTPDDSSGILTRTTDIRLSFANESSSLDDFSKSTQGGEGPQKKSRHWPWMGKIYMAAIYCQALTDNEILGSTAPKPMPVPQFNVDITKSITPSVKKAETLFNRLNGVRTAIDNPTLFQMADLMDRGQNFEAAELATKDPYYGHQFYNITVKEFATPMSTREENLGASLNDFVATIIGVTRDGIDARKLLTDNIVYAANSSKAGVPNNIIRDRLTSNRHYEALEQGRFNLADVLEKTTQKIFNGSVAVDPVETAGLLTTRAYMAAHAVAGTNRRPVEYAFRAFLCTPIEKLANSSGSDSMIGRDIDRFPGGSHTKFTQNCRACHTRLDPLRGAFSYFTFSNNQVKHSFLNNRLPANANNEDMSSGMKTGVRNADPALTQLSDKKNLDYVVTKMNHNDHVFPGGRIVIDNSYINTSSQDLWGQQYFGWRGATTGNGVQQFGTMIAQSEQFSRCMTQRVFETICKRQPASSENNYIQNIAKEFETKNYKLDYLFKRVASSPECK